MTHQFSISTPSASSLLLQGNHNCYITFVTCALSGGVGAADNTRVALHFANAAKRVTMQPHVNEVVNQKALLRKLRDEVALLRKQLVRHLSVA